SATGSEPVAAEQEQNRWHYVEVVPGDTLAGIFDTVGLSTRTMYDVLAAGEAAKTLARIFPGEQISFLIDGGELQAMRYPVDESITLHIDRSEEGYQTSLVAVPLERRLAHAV